MRRRTSLSYVMPRSPLILLDRAGADRDYDLGLILHLAQHPNLAVRHEPGQHARRVIVVEQLAAEFEIQLAAEGVDAFPYAVGLHTYILVIVKPDFVHDFIF